MAYDISAQALFAAIEAYCPQSPQRSSLHHSEPYLFEPIEQEGGAIPGNGDFLIEHLSDDDLNSPIDLV